MKKNTDYIHDKFTTAQEINKSTSDNFKARLTKLNLASKNGIADFVKKDIFWW